LLWQNVAAELPSPMITPAPIQPTHENLRRQSMILERLKQRAEGAAVTSTSTEDTDVEEITYCFGTGSICEQSNNLFALCEKEYPPGSDSDPMDYYIKVTTCQCEQGFAAADQACNWCQFAFNTSVTIFYEDSQTWSSVCSSYTATLAPIPASALSAISAYNETYSYYVPGLQTGNGGGGATPTPGTGTSVSNSGSISRTTSEVQSAAGTTTSTFFGGGGGQTTASPLVTHSGTAQPSSTPNGSSGFKYAQGWEKIVYLACWGFVVWSLL